MLKNRKYIIFEPPESADDLFDPPDEAKVRKYFQGSYNKRLVLGILEYNGFIPTTGNDFNIAWVSPNESDQMNFISRLQSINHFPFSKKILGNKAELANIIQNNPNGDMFDNFFPRTFILPKDREVLYKIMKSRPEIKFIAKPPGGSCGHGIKLVSFINFYSIPSGAVVSEYINRPLTIDSFKFDLRIYVLVTSWAPLRAFICREGIARFATESYSKLTENPYSHLTNATLNKHNEKYSTDFKWKLSELLNEVEHRFKKDPDELMNEVVAVVSQTLALVQPTMAPDIRHGVDAPFFEIYGFDVLIDREFKPYILEINTFPSLTYDTDVDFEVKAPMVAQALSIAGIVDMDYNELIREENLISCEEDEIENLDKEIVEMEDLRNEKSGNGWIRLFPADYNDDLQPLLSVPRFQNYNKKIKKENIDPRELGKAFSSAQGIELLKSYLEVLLDKVRSGGAGKRTTRRIQAFLSAQGYSLRPGVGIIVPLENFIERAKAWINLVRTDKEIPDKVKAKIIESGDMFVAQVLTNCHMRHVKDVSTLFS